MRIRPSSLLQPAIVAALSIALAASAVGQTPDKAVDAYNQAVRLYNADKKAESLPAFEGAVALGSVDAMVDIGDMYSQGDGVAEDNAKAAEWYVKAMAAGNAKATYRIAQFHEKGTEWVGNLCQGRGQGL